MISVKFFATIRQAAETSETIVEINNGTVGQVINDLIVKYGGKFGDTILENDGRLKKNIKVLLNGRDIDYINGLDSAIKDKDTIYLFPAIAGG